MQGSLLMLRGKAQGTISRHRSSCHCEKLINFSGWFGEPGTTFLWIRWRLLLLPPWLAHVGGKAALMQKVQVRLVTCPS